MQNTYATWSHLLDEHLKLLLELATSLNTEKSALLANEIYLLREASLQKDKTLRRIQNFQKQFLAFQTEQSKGLGHETVSLTKLLTQFAPAEQKQLEKKRLELVRLSRTIQRRNQFNEKCMRTYLNQVTVWQSLFSLVTKGSQTYTAEGSANLKTTGRLIDRSF